MSYLPVLELTRGNIVESLHYGAFAVADAAGRLVASYGDPHTVTFLRSSAKPFQAISLVESGAAEAFGLTPREIALACASHKAMEMHVEAVLAMQSKIGVRESDLLCGAHEPGDPEAARRLRREGRAPTPNHNNCSGKHTGMLAQAKHRGLPLADYINPQHGLQQTILQNFAEMCALRVDAVVVGVDGCSAPNFAVPLVAAATAFARLADPGSLSPSRAAALRAIFSAMTAHPEMVSGPGGFDTELMRARPGLLLAKGGAEGYEGLGIAPGARGPGSPALGVALKIADGASRAIAPVALEILRQLGALGEGELKALEGLGFGLRLPVKNWRGLVVGEARTCFALADGG
jgi:L-asparaginase II